MTPQNILDINTRDDFRKWLSENHDTAKECWIAARRGKTPPTDPPTGKIKQLDGAKQRALPQTRKTWHDDRCRPCRMPRS